MATARPIRHLREAFGIPARVLAEAAGVSVGHWASIERSEAPGSPAAREAICALVAGNLERVLFGDSLFDEKGGGK